jgi:hypothetical protein
MKYVIVFLFLCASTAAHSCPWMQTGYTHFGEEKDFYFEEGTDFEIQAHIIQKLDDDTRDLHRLALIEEAQADKIEIDQSDSVAAECW